MGGVKAHDVGAEAGASRQAAGVPGDVLPGESEASVGAEMGEHGVIMGKQQGALGVEVGFGSVGAGTEVVGDLGGEPRAAVAGAADHDAICAGQGFGGGGVLWGVDVAIDDNGNGNGLLDVGDERPVGDAGVELLTCAAMDDDHPYAAGFGDLGHAGGVQAGVVPAHAHLECDGNADGAHSCFQYGGSGDFVAHEGGAGLLSNGNLADRAAKIYVDDFGAHGFAHAGGFGHGGRFATGELDGTEARTFIKGGHAQRVAILAQHGPGRDHFGHDHAGAQAFGKTTERQVGDARHRSEDDRHVERSALAKMYGVEFRVRG